MEIGLRPCLFTITLSPHATPKTLTNPCTTPIHSPESPLLNPMQPPRHTRHSQHSSLLMQISKNLKKKSQNSSRKNLTKEYLKE